MTKSAIEISGLSQAEVDRFQADGFLLVEDFFDISELDRFAAAVDAAVLRGSHDCRFSRPGQDRYWLQNLQ